MLEMSVRGSSSWQFLVKMLASYTGQSRLFTNNSLL